MRRNSTIVLLIRSGRLCELRWMGWDVLDLLAIGTILEGKWSMVNKRYGRVSIDLASG